MKEAQNKIQLAIQKKEQELAKLKEKEKQIKKKLAEKEKKEKEVRIKALGQKLDEMLQRKYGCGYQESNPAEAVFAVLERCLDAQEPSAVPASRVMETPDAATKQEGNE